MLKKVRKTVVMIRECITMSLENIRGNKVRSFLTVLGILIGVTAVIALITTVSGVSGSLSSSFSSMGAGTLTISVTGSDLKEGLTKEDADSSAIVEKVLVAVGGSVSGGDAVASLRTAKVYVEEDGTVGAVFGREGESVDVVTENYGAVIVTLVDGSNFKVEVTEGEFESSETVKVYRSDDCDNESRIGRGSISKASPVAYTGSGTVANVYAADGEHVERGTLLYETVETDASAI